MRERQIQLMSYVESSSTNRQTDRLYSQPLDPVRIWMATTQFTKIPVPCLTFPKKIIEIH